MTPAIPARSSTSSWRVPRGEQGQTTAELALLAPLLGLAALVVVQVGLIVRDHVLVAHATREAVRSAAVDPDPAAAAAAARHGAPGLDPSRLDVAVVRREQVGGSVEVVVTYRSPTDVAVIGPLVGEPELTASAVMRVER